LPLARSRLGSDCRSAPHSVPGKGPDQLRRMVGGDQELTMPYSR
jgi:hypothetical protein